MLTLEQHFQQFLRERVYLHNITPATRDYYLSAWKAFVRAHAATLPRAPDAPVLTLCDLQLLVAWVECLRSVAAHRRRHPGARVLAAAAGREAVAASP